MTTITAIPTEVRATRPHARTAPAHWAVFSSFQVIALIAASVLGGASFATAVSGWLWAAAAVIGVAMLMHGFAEILAARIKKQEEYVGAAPPVALLPWFLAGSFFPIGAMPAGLTAFAKVLPVTHALALMRYGLVDHAGHGLHDIWGLRNTPAMATLSLPVVAVSALGVLALSTRRSPPPPACSVFTAPRETLRWSGLDEAINQSRRYDAIRPRVWGMDRATEMAEIRRLSATPDVVIGSVSAVTETGALVAVSASGSQLPA